MNRDLVFAALAIVLVGIVGSASATDRWDASNGDCLNDIDAFTCNQLLHGQPQEHDVQSTSPTRDADWSVVETKARHSYEVRVFSASVLIGDPTLLPSTAALRMHRVNSSGTILTAAFSPDGHSNSYSDAGGWSTVRWIGGANNQRDYIRVEGPNFSNPNSNSGYVIELLDTTYFIPRFNNSGSQITVLLIQNTTAAPVAGNIYFYSAAGLLLHSEPLILSVHGLQVVSTSSIGALAGLTGSATIAHTGGYGALAGKAVALEPATGFSFDTLMVPLPR